MSNQITVLSSHNLAFYIYEINYAIESAGNHNYEINKCTCQSWKERGNLNFQCLLKRKVQKIDIAKLIPTIMDCPGSINFVEENCTKTPYHWFYFVNNNIFILWKEWEHRRLIEHLKKNKTNFYQIHRCTN